MPQKIDSIKFNNYRAFYGNFPEIVLEGKNLLVWGENGSGKSSFCKAISDLVCKKKDDAHQKNMFSVNDWSVNFKINGVSFDFDSENEIEEAAINNCFLVSPFLNYRQILSLYFAPDSQNNEVKLLQIIEKLLAEFPITEKGGRKLKNLKDEPDYIELFSNLLNFKLKGKILDILNSFNLNFKIEEFVLEDNEVFIKTSIFGEQITERCNDFLNEARLSALSISVYLAAIKELSISQDEILDILVLDDMLIGLDMGNRMSVFDIIKTHFANTQVFFFTYDKAWFEVFRDKVDETKWISLEMYAQSVDINNKKFEVPFLKEKKDDWLRAAEDLYTNFDYDNCGNLLRKELENQIDKYLGISNCNLEQKLHLSSLKNIKLLNHEVSKKVKKRIDLIREELELDDVFDGKLRSIEGLLRKNENNTSLFNINVMKELKDRILNPASHKDSLKPFYRQELEKALEAIVELMKTNNIEIDWPAERERIIKSIRKPVLRDAATPEPAEPLTNEDQNRLNNFNQGVEDDFSGNP